MHRDGLCEVDICFGQSPNSVRVNHCTYGFLCNSYHAYGDSYQVQLSLFGHTTVLFCYLDKGESFFPCSRGTWRCVLKTYFISGLSVMICPPYKGLSVPVTPFSFQNRPWGIMFLTSNQTSKIPPPHFLNNRVCFSWAPFHISPRSAYKALMNCLS